MPRWPDITAKARFEAKYVPEPNSGCWLWVAGLGGNGYGVFWNGVNREVAHRFSYKLYKGPIPDDLELDHLCRMRCCVNPEHLEPVTSAINVLRGMGTGAIYARRTHCERGHLMLGDNLRIKSDGTRQCVQCKLIWAAMERRRKGIPCRKK